MKGDDWPIVGYTDRISVAPGGVIRVMVSSDSESYTASVVRLGGPQPKAVDVVGTGTFFCRQQPIHTGSYIFVPHSHLFDSPAALTAQAWIFPTLPRAGRVQGLVTRWSPVASSGWGLFLDETGRLLFRLQARGGKPLEYTSDQPLRARNWYHVTCSYDNQTRRVRLTQQALQPWPEARSSVEFGSPAHLDRLATVDVSLPLLIGAGRWQSNTRPHAEELYDGKIENPSLFTAMLDDQALDRLCGGAPPQEVAGEALLAAWDFSIGISSAEITDTSRNGLNGTAINTPMRATTGHSWRAGEQCYKHALGEYAAIYFHSDDLSDAGWEPDFDLQIPADLASGAYAVHLAAGPESDELPFFVLPQPSSRAPIAFLAPTFTYQAYANEHFWSDTGSGPKPGQKPDPADLYVAKHSELGRGLYDCHVDGSGCCYSSRLRPIPNMRPDYRHFESDGPRHFSSDLLFLQWLERKGYQYDVITDEELHAVGKDAVSDYRVVITGSHPEYYTAAMLDALNSYLDSGGKLMYLGGNGFYWVTSVDRDKPYIIEVRRGVAGSRTWSSAPGELYHSTTGEFGGLWRHRGRSPNQLVGVGFSAIGYVGASGYVPRAGTLRKEAAFIFRCLEEDEIIGDFGAILGGAAGDEVDRMDSDLGSPPTAILLASAKLNQFYLLVIEDIVQSIRNQDATTNPRARADIVYLTRGDGGAVFSVGSITWFGSIGFNHDDNNVSRVTENVLNHFLGSEN